MLPHAAHRVPSIAAQQSVGGSVTLDKHNWRHTPNGWSVNAANLNGIHSVVVPH
jgi:hypothetical protein